MKYTQSRPAPRRVELDVTDRKILAALAENVRLPASWIAKRIGMSRDAVSYRIANLKKRGIVQGTRVLVDAAQLGFMSTHIFLQLNQPLPEAEKKLIETFQAYPFVRAIIKFNGKYDFELAVVHKNIQELDTIIDRIITDSSAYLQHYDILFLTKTLAARAFPRNFLSEKQAIAIKKHHYKDRGRVDAVDLRMLGLLSENADIPLHELGSAVGLSADGAKYRLRSMQASGLIRKFIPVINYDVIGYNTYAIMLSIKDFTAQREATLREFCNQNKDVLWGSKCIGRFNVLLYICTRDPNDLVATTTALRTHFAGAITEYETLINYEEYKYVYFLKSMAS